MATCATCGERIRGFVWWDVATAKDFCQACYQTLLAQRNGLDLQPSEASPTMGTRDAK